MTLKSGTAGFYRGDKYSDMGGRQEGAEISYNPTKRKRPSHVLHTFLVANQIGREQPLESKQMRLDQASPSVYERG